MYFVGKLLALYLALFLLLRYLGTKTQSNQKLCLSSLYVFLISLVLGFTFLLSNSLIGADTSESSPQSILRDDHEIDRNVGNLNPDNTSKDPEKKEGITRWDTLGKKERGECKYWTTTSRFEFPAQDDHYFASQNNQDALLYKIFFYDKLDGVYFDLAAFDPRFISNTYFFDVCLGWEGICVEGDYRKWGDLESQRTCKLKKSCVADKEGEMYFVSDGTGLSGLQGHNKVNLEGLKDGTADERKLKCFTVSQILDEYKTEIPLLPHIDYFSLDIEGAEMMALRGIDFSKVQIDIFTAEISDPRDSDVNDFLISHGYIPLLKTGDDTIFIHNSTKYVAMAEDWYRKFSSDMRRRSNFRWILKL